MTVDCVYFKFGSILQPYKCVLLRVQVRKKTNLSVAADVATADEMLHLAELVGPHICVFKTHVDIFDRWDDGIAQKLQQIAEVSRCGLCNAHPSASFPCNMFTFK
jgi:hypothetical protein